MCFFGIQKQLCPYFLTLYYSISDFFCQHFLQPDIVGRAFNKSIIMLTFAVAYAIIITEPDSPAMPTLWRRFYERYTYRGFYFFIVNRLVYTGYTLFKRERIFVQ